MKVRDVMAAPVVSAERGDSIGAVAAKMAEADCGFVPVVEGGDVVGVVTDRDIAIRAVAEGTGPSARSPVGLIMSGSVHSVDADAEIEAAAHLMAEHAVRRLPVMEAGALAGVLSYGHLEQLLHAEGAAAAEATLGVTQGA